MDAAVDAGVTADASTSDANTSCAPRGSGAIAGSAYGHSFAEIRSATMLFAETEGWWIMDLAEDQNACFTSGGTEITITVCDTTITAGAYQVDYPSVQECNIPGTVNVLFSSADGVVDEWATMGSVTFEGTQADGCLSGSFDIGFEPPAGAGQFTGTFTVLNCEP